MANSGVHSSTAHKPTHQSYTQKNDLMEQSIIKKTAQAMFKDFAVSSKDHSQFINGGFATFSSHKAKELEMGIALDEEIENSNLI